MAKPTTHPQFRDFIAGRRWPNRLRNIWLQNLGFVALAIFSAVILTQPAVTAWVLLGMFALATGLSLVFERRAFCRYLCPVGGFVGLYAQAAPLELRVLDPAVCAAHRQKTCYQGNENGYGCPWQVYPGALQKNTYCGMCLECLRTCPRDNVALFLRPPGADLGRRAGRRLDEAFKAFIMLGSAVLYSAVLLGPWGGLKAAAYAVGTAAWAGYAAAFVAILLAGLPGLFWLGQWAGRKAGLMRRGTRQAFVDFSYALVPLGLAAWAAFSLAFVFANGSYVAVTLSDPFGWGWDLLGTVSLGWRPVLSGTAPSLQAAVLLAGLAWSARTARRIGEEDGSTGWQAALPTTVFAFLATGGLLWLLTG